MVASAAWPIWRAAAAIQRTYTSVGVDPSEQCVRASARSSSASATTAPTNCSARKILSLIFGAASFVDSTTVDVKLNDGGTRRLSTRKIVINTGGRPLVPQIPGLASVGYSRFDIGDGTRRTPTSTWSSLAVATSDSNSARCTAASAREVTIVQRGPRLVEREDPEISDAVRKIFGEDGIRVDTEAAVERIERDDAGDITRALRMRRLRTLSDWLTYLDRDRPANRYRRSKSSRCWCNCG